MSRAKNVVEIIARALADRPDNISVIENEGHQGVHVELSTAGKDLGRMIGRQGRTASAIRVLAGLVAEPEDSNVTVDFVDNP